MDISIFGLIISSLLLIPPILMFYFKKINLTKVFLISIGRMIVQLALIGLILQYLFEYNSLLLTLLWVIIMLGAAIYTIMERLEFSYRFIFPVIFFPLFTTTLIMLPFVICLIIQPSPLFNPRYLIPIYGMILGNSMNSTALGLERFYSQLSNNLKAYYTYIALGSTPEEATLPMVQQSLKASLLPRIMNVSAMGIITLPGMMTGQILSGASPFTAIKYQIVIMLVIFSSVSFNVSLSLKIFIKNYFDKYYLPKFK